MDQLKRTKDGFFEIVDKNSPHGKVWFNNPKDYPRIVKSSRTAFIIYQISSCWEKQGKESIPWDNFLIPENIRGGETHIQYSLSKNNYFSFNLNQAAFVLLGLDFWALTTKYFVGFDIEKHRDDESRLEHIFWRSAEYKALRSSNCLHRGLDDIWMTDNKDLVGFAKEEGFFSAKKKHSFTETARTRRQQQLITKKCNEILTKSPKAKKLQVAEEISDWLEDVHQIHLFASSIERNYLKGFRELKAEKIYIKNNGKSRKEKFQKLVDLLDPPPEEN